MKLYLDNERDAPNGWTAVRSSQALLSALRTGAVTHVSMDHDLGPGAPSGLDILKGMAAQNLWPSASLRVHSGNVAGAQAMKALIRTKAPAHLQRPTSTPYTRALTKSHY